MQENLFRAAARYYDAGIDQFSGQDVPFYLKLAADAKGDILELACGTGRVAIPLAEAGHQVWGLDLSNEMLEVFHKRLEGLDPEVRSRIHIRHGNMSRFDLGRRFGLIIIAFRSFQALTTRAEQTECLKCVHHHLSSGGRFVLEVFLPYAHLDASWKQPEKMNLETVNPETGRKIRRGDIRREIDVDNQIIYPDLVYYIEREDGGEDRIIEPLALKYWYPGQLPELLEQQGFRVVEDYGNYDGTPLGQGPEQIFVCERRDESQ